MTPFGTRSQRRGNLDNPKPARDGFDRQLSLDFKAAAKDRNGLNKLAVEGAITGKDVSQTHPKGGIEDRQHQPITPTIQLLKVAACIGMQTRSHNHIGIAAEDW